MKSGLPPSQPFFHSCLLPPDVSGFHTHQTSCLPRAFAHAMCARKTRSSLLITSNQPSPLGALAAWATGQSLGHMISCTLNFSSTHF